MMPDIQENDSENKSHKRFIRTSYAVYSTLILFTLFFGILNFYQGLIYSGFAALFAVVGYIISMYFLIKKKEFIKGTFAVYLTLGPAALCASYFEGLMSGYIWFLFSMVYAIPFMIKREDYFYKQTRNLYIITFAIIAITVIISPMYSKVHSHISVEDSHAKFFIISIACFIIILILNKLALSTGEVYVQKIFKAKQQAINEKESRTRTLSNISHELRTQINSINGVTQLILENNRYNKEDKKHIEILEYCNNNMLVLVNDMLDMHKIESGGFELFEEPKSMDKLLSKVLIPFVNKVEEKKLTLNNNIDERLKNTIVNVDETRLMQVLHNLLSNAIKFTECGYITFSADFINETCNTVEVKFSVEDTGMGISSNHFNTIFDSFQQIQSKVNPVYGGTGLGLAISKTIVEKMKAAIHVESTIGQGTLFHFTINFEKLNVIPVKYNKKNKFDKVSFSNTTVLVVEDNAISMLYAIKLLNGYGVKTYQAINGLKAIDKIKEYNDIDIVLLDLEMPVMDGFKAINHIRMIDSDIVVIAFTANIPNQEMIQKLKNLGFDDIISKPFKKEDMYKKLQKYALQKLKLPQLV